MPYGKGSKRKGTKSGGGPRRIDMSKLRSQQARSRKGISEWQHFKQPSQGDEPIVEYMMKRKK